MIRLYIENTEIELDENVQFAITKQFEELSNPTTIINDWSKTVSIPFTVNNNKTFGHIYCPDKVTVASNNILTGIYFDPLKKLNFRLEWDGNVVMVGYAKMNEIKKVDDYGTYEITLFGQLGKLFQDLSKITFDRTIDDSTYLIKGEDYVAEYINMDLVYNSWDSSGQTLSSLVKKDEQGYNVTDIIGFAPNNAFSNEFKYDTVQTSSKSNILLSKLLDSMNFETKTGVPSETVIGNGILPRQIGEFRSYNQLPFVYWNKLFKMFQVKAEEITGYTFQLDNSWFNVSNPFWYQTVYMLKPFNQQKQEGVTNYYSVGINIIDWISSSGAQLAERFIYVHNTTESFPLVNQFETAPAIFTGDASYSLNMKYNIGIILSETGSSNPYSTRIYTNNALELNVYVLNENDTIIDEEKYLVCDENYTGSTAGYDETHLLKQGDFTSAGEYPNRYRYVLLNPQISYRINYIQASSAKIKYTAKWRLDGPRFLHTYTEGGTPDATLPPTHIYSSDTYSSLEFQKDYTKRTNSYFTFNDLWNNEYNLFDEILKYCKMHRILITVDELNKKIQFVLTKTYFNNYSILNWSDKLDKSKDYIIKPITFENKYILFNYSDSKIAIGEDYKQKYGLNFGEYKLTTDYNFNEETTNLFDKITQSVVSTDNVLSFLTLLRGEIKYTFAKEFFVTNKDKDGKQVDIFGAFYFYNGKASFDTNNSLLPYPYLSDDSPLQLANNTYYYTYVQSYRTLVSTYPALDVISGTSLCLFNIPKENYTYRNNYTNASTIYSSIWQKYLDERYNIQNKLVTCYLRIKPRDWCNFAFNHFIQLGNQIYMINKIYDYDVTSTESTKVDLITILNIAGYIN